MTRKRPSSGHSTIDWTTVFAVQYPVPGASSVEIHRHLTAFGHPLTDEEIEKVNRSQSNPFPPSDPLYSKYRPFNPALWIIPIYAFPASYIEFLSWSNGGSFFNQERHFDPFFPCAKLRNYLLGYHLPQYMPGAVPFAFDGSGGMYLFDMREKPSNGEFPILFADSGNLQYAASTKIGESFVEACTGNTNPQDEL